MGKSKKILSEIDMILANQSIPEREKLKRIYQSRGWAEDSVGYIKFVFEMYGKGNR